MEMTFEFQECRTKKIKMEKPEFLENPFGLHTLAEEYFLYGETLEKMNRNVMAQDIMCKFSQK